ncbi:hypothetical protein FBQ95_17015 [Chloroflexi bacterium CFX3]|nr:hypothetical protein [Chloroflexi bacterium CFX3]
MDQQKVEGYRELISEWADLVEQCIMYAVVTTDNDSALLDYLERRAFSADELRMIILGVFKRADELED